MPSTFSFSHVQKGYGLKCFVYARRHGHRTDEDGIDENCWVYPLAFLGSFPSGNETKYTLRFSCALFFGGPSTKDVNRVSLAGIAWPNTPTLFDLFSPRTDSACDLLHCFNDSPGAVECFDQSPERDLGSINSAKTHFAFGDTALPSFAMEAAHGIVNGDIYSQSSDYWKIVNQVRGYITRPSPNREVDLCHAKQERKKLTNRMRRQVLERDGFKCVDCGRSPQNDPSCILHVDHRLAIANGGDKLNGQSSNLVRLVQSGQEN
jgi:hypothetical protein